MPVQAPDHSVNKLPESAVAVNVTEAPDVSDFEQAAPQLMPAGLDVTVPEPLPLFDTVSV